MTDYYKILGVSKNASEEDIKRAYRKLAMTYHPDKGGDTEKFQSISEAYDVLSNPERRQVYDNEPKNFGFQDFFAARFGMFGGFPGGPMRKNAKCQNKTLTVNVSLDEIYTGLTKRFKLTRDILCDNCNIACTQCNGNGIKVQQVRNGPFLQVVHQACNTCGGQGKIRDETVITGCDCEGKGTKQEQRVVELVIPKGAESGFKYVIEEWGFQSSRSGEIPGDMVIMVVIDSHHVFSRRCLDLYMEIDITLVESIVGKIIIIPHFTGPIKLQIGGFGIINPNKQYTIYHKGLCDEKGNNGNLHLTFNIKYPDRVFNDNERNELTALFQKLALP